MRITSKFSPEEIGPGFYDLLRRVAERHMGPKDGITIACYDNNAPDFDWHKYNYRMTEEEKNAKRAESKFDENDEKDDRQSE